MKPLIDTGLKTDIFSTRIIFNTEARRHKDFLQTKVLIFERYFQPFEHIELIEPFEQNKPLKPLKPLKPFKPFKPLKTA